MTGYLWLCERCDGQGFKFLISYSDKKQIYGLQIGGIITYCGGKPEWIECHDCCGRGYWEP